MVMDFVRVAREQLAGLAHDIGLTSKHRHVPVRLRRRD
jgi:hypothetical protein